MKKHALILIALLAPPTFADKLLVEPAQSMNFVERKPSSEELEVKAEIEKPRPKEAIATEIPDDQTEASDCAKCRINPGSPTPQHAALAKIPLSAISN